MDAQGQDLGHLGQKVDIDRQMLFDEWKEWNEYIRRYTSQLITMTSIVIPAWLLLVGYALAQIDDSILKIVMLAVAGGIALGMIIEFTLSIRLVGKWSERFRSIEDALGMEHIGNAETVMHGLRLGIVGGIVGLCISAGLIYYVLRA